MDFSSLDFVAAQKAKQTAGGAQLGAAGALAVFMRQVGAQALVTSDAAAPVSGAIEQGETSRRHCFGQAADHALERTARNDSHAIPHGETRLLVAASYVAGKGGVIDEQPGFGRQATFQPPAKAIETVLWDGRETFRAALRQTDEAIRIYACFFGHG
jgi:hypothetical protein